MNNRGEEPDSRGDIVLGQDVTQPNQERHSGIFAFEASGRHADLAQLRQVSARVLLDHRRKQFGQVPLLRQPGVGGGFQRIGAEGTSNATAARVGVQRGRPAAIAEVTAHSLIGVDPSDMADEVASDEQLLTAQRER